MRLLATFVVLLLGAGCPLPSNVVFRCEPDATCAQKDYACAADGYCYPASQVLEDGGVLPPDAGPCVPKELDALCAAAECGFVDDGCGEVRDCQKRCVAGMECGVASANRCAYATLCTGEGWCWEHPLPQGLNLLAGFRLDARRTWWVGENHVIVFFDGERSRLQENAGSYGDDLLDVHGNAIDHVFAVGESGLILHFNGTEWERESTPTPLTSALRTVFAFADGGAIAAGAQGRVISRAASTSPFTRWSTEPFPVTNDVRAVFGDATGETLYAVTRANELFSRPTAMPGNWTRLDTVPLQETLAATVRGERLVFGGLSGTRDTLVEREVDGGWRSLVDGGGINVLGLERGDGGLFVVGANQEHAWLDDADGYTRVTAPLGGWTAGIALEGPTLQLGGLLGSQALLDLDGGFTWLSSPRPTPGLALNAVCGASPGTMYAAGGTDQAQACATCRVKWLERELTTAGARWSVKDLQLGNTTRLLACFAEPGRAWLTGNDSKYVFLSAAGAEFGDFGSTVYGQYRGAWGTPDAGYFFVRDSQELTVSPTGIDGFVVSGRSAPSALRAVWGLDETDFVTVGTNGFVTVWTSDSSQSVQLGGGAPEFLAVHGVRLPSGERRYAIGGTQGSLMSVTGDAGVFTQVGMTTVFSSTWVAPSGTAWAAGQREGRAVVSRQEPGGAWTADPIQLPRAVSGLFGFEREDGGVSVWISGPGGAVLRKDTR